METIKPADAAARIVITMTATNDRDADRLELLDRIADRVPELDLDAQSVEWTMLDDGCEALLVNGGGIDGGGAPVRFRMLHVFDIRDDLISREQAWFDTAEVTRQLESHRRGADEPTGH